MYNSKTSIMEKRQEESLVWLDWAKELQFIAQAGLTYSKDPFDLERFQRIREISAEIVSRQTGLSFERVTDLFCGETGFQTPKLDTRAAIIHILNDKSCRIVYRINSLFPKPYHR